jgi:hypothetical protein
MWCHQAPHEWNKDEEEIPQNHKEDWTIEKLKVFKLQVSKGRLKNSVQIHGVVEVPSWDVIEVNHYVYPVLHKEIGLVNNTTNAFYDLLDDTIEVMSDAEKISCKTAIFSDAALESAIEGVSDWKHSSTIDLSLYNIFKSEISNNLKK